MQESKLVCFIILRTLEFNELKAKLFGFRTFRTLLQNRGMWGWTVPINLKNYSMKTAKSQSVKSSAATWPNSRIGVN
jgi:hypothetical protein